MGPVLCLTDFWWVGIDFIRFLLEVRQGGFRYFLIRIAPLYKKILLFYVLTYYNNNNF